MLRNEQIVHEVIIDLQWFCELTPNGLDYISGKNCQLTPFNYVLDYIYGWIFFKINLTKLY